MMTLFSKADDPWSHRTRIVLAEKSIHVETIDVHGGNLPEDLLDLNPYNTVPTLVDRDLVLYDSRVIIEYLDERFPHPPLMPVDPVARAQFRMALFRIEKDWYSLAQQIDEQREDQPLALLGRRSESQRSDLGQLRNGVVLVRRVVHAVLVERRDLRLGHLDLVVLDGQFGELLTGALGGVARGRTRQAGRSDAGRVPRRYDRAQRA